MLKIYGADLSTPANKVRFVANYLGIPYEYQRVKLREGEHRQEWFRAMTPVGKIPVIDDGGFVLFESNAICKYLARKQDSDIYPNDPKQQAKIDQWIDFITIHIQGAMGRIVYNRIFVPVIPNETVDERSLQDGLKFVKRFLPVVETQLSAHAYVAGDALSLADFCLLTSLDPAEAAQVDLAAYPHIQAWRAKLQAQDFYKKCFKNYQEALEQFAAFQKK